LILYIHNNFLFSLIDKLLIENAKLKNSLIDALNDKNSIKEFNRDLIKENSELKIELSKIKKK
jgi:hypothetical protein